jgi:hypothetical protein
MLQRFVSVWLGVALSTTIASAQTISVPNVINVGDDIEIGFTDASKAGQTVLIRISIASPSWSHVEVAVQLDKRGCGSVSWTVPAADAVAFNAPDARQVTRML